MSACSPPPDSSGLARSDGPGVNARGVNDSIPDVLVIGGGVIGLSAAWRLRQRGAAVTLVEAGSIPGFMGDTAPTEAQATWASAGMLAPFAGMTAPHRLVDLGVASLGLYPAFCEDLSEASGCRFGMEGAGRVTLALDDSEPEDLRRRLSWQKQYGMAQEWLSPAAVSTLEPRLAGGTSPGVRCTAEKYVPPRELLKVLCRAAAAAGVRLCPGARVDGFKTRGSSVEAAVCNGEMLNAGQFVLAAGAWMAELAKALGTRLPVAPVKGQALQLRAHHGLTHTVSTSAGLLSPRGQTSLWVGATEEPYPEHCGVTSGAVRRLLGLAERLLPHLEAAVLMDAWAGFRPSLPDNLPVIGGLPGWENVHAAGGHFRKGILLAPVTADLLTGWVLDRRADPLMIGLGAERFALPAPVS